MHRLTAQACMVLVVLAGSACSGGDDAAPATASSDVPDGWEVEQDEDFSIAVPADWTYSRESSEAGNEFVSLTGPREVSGYPESVVVGRTRDVPESDVARIVDLFRNVQGDRTFGEEREVDIPGGTAEVLLESERLQGEERVPVKAWNVFALTPSSVNLNIELVAPEEVFDEELFETILGTLELKEREQGPAQS